MVAFASLIVAAFVVVCLGQVDDVLIRVYGVVDCETQWLHSTHWFLDNLLTTHQLPSTVRIELAVANTNPTLLPNLTNSSVVLNANIPLLRTNVSNATVAGIATASASFISSSHLCGSMLQSVSRITFQIENRTAVWALRTPMLEGGNFSLASNSSLGLPPNVVVVGDIDGVEPDEIVVASSTSISICSAAPSVSCSFIESATSTQCQSEAFEPPVDLPLCVKGALQVACYAPAFHCPLTSFVNGGLYSMIAGDLVGCTVQQPVPRPFLQCQSLALASGADDVALFRLSNASYLVFTSNSSVRIATISKLSNGTFVATVQQQRDAVAARSLGNVVVFDSSGDGVVDINLPTIGRRLNGSVNGSNMAPVVFAIDNGTSLPLLSRAESIALTSVTARQLSIVVNASIVTVPVGQPQSQTPPLSAVVCTARAIWLWTDCDGDADVDLVQICVGNFELIVYRNNDGKLERSSNTLRFKNRVASAVLSELNYDGLEDVYGIAVTSMGGNTDVAAAFAAFNMGGCAFVERALAFGSAPSPRASSLLMSLDIDSDGDADPVFVGSDGVRFNFFETPIGRAAKSVSNKVVARAPWPHPLVVTIVDARNDTPFFSQVELRDSVTGVPFASRQLLPSTAGAKQQSARVLFHSSDMTRFYTRDYRPLRLFDIVVWFASDLLVAGNRTRPAEPVTIVGAHWSDRSYIVRNGDVRVVYPRAYNTHLVPDKVTCSNVTAIANPGIGRFHVNVRPFYNAGIFVVEPSNDEFDALKRAVRVTIKSVQPEGTVLQFGNGRAVVHVEADTATASATGVDVELYGNATRATLSLAIASSHRDTRSEVADVNAEITLPEPIVVPTPMPTPMPTTTTSTTTMPTTTTPSAPVTSQATPPSSSASDSGTALAQHSDTSGTLLLALILVFCILLVLAVVGGLLWWRRRDRRGATAAASSQPNRERDDEIAMQTVATTGTTQEDYARAPPPRTEYGSAPPPAEPTYDAVTMPLE